MSASSKNDLTALVGSRICHDLISPLGAIGNGLELLQMTGLNSSPELSLISESIESANARVRFFRIAYGNAEAGQMVKGSEIASVLKAVYHASRVDIEWEPTDMPRIDAKLALLTLQCLETAMPYGGQILVSIAETGLTFRAIAKRLVIEEPLWATLTQCTKDIILRPAQVQFGLLADMIHQDRRRMTIELKDDEICVAF